VAARNHPGVDQLAVPLPAPRTVPEPLVELLARHDPVRAAQVRRRGGGPAPDTVLVLGPAEQAVGRLAAALAGRVPALVRCAPVGELPVREARIAETRAVVWVFDAHLPVPGRDWAQLAELAGQVDEVHLALAGSEPGRGAGHQLGVLRERLAEALPRLADAPLHLLADGHGELVAALARPPEQPGYRNALRVLATGLAEALDRRVARLRRARRRASAVDQALAGQRDELVGRYREAATEWPRRLRAEVAQLGLTTAAELSGAVRRLRDDARGYLAKADREARARFPELFLAAASALRAGLHERFDGLFGALLGPESGGRTGPDPEISPPDGPGRPPLEDRLILVVGASGGLGALGLGRLALSSAAAPNVAGPVWSAALPAAVGLGVAGAWWLARARRALAERARLGRWVAEVLEDLRIGMQAMLAERLLDAEHRLGLRVDRDVTERSTEMSGELREHDRLARRIVALRAEQTGSDNAAVAELKAARHNLLGLMAGTELPGSQTTRPEMAQ
jgi:hypothetical protein